MAAFSTNNTRWAALQSRNPLAASAFIYSVITTKIYCRPTCPSRLARRANIIFHDTPAEAEAAGFRPCKRCRPNLRENEGDPQIAAVEKACQLIIKEEKGAVKWTVKGLAKEVGLTESHFCRVFKKITGMTIGDYRMVFQAGKTDSNFRHSNMIAAPRPQQLEVATATSDHAPESIFSSEDLSLSATDLCPPDLMQDWQNFSGMQTPEDYIPESADLALVKMYSFDFVIPDTMEIAEDCFQFVDFNTAWMTEISQDAVL